MFSELVDNSFVGCEAEISPECVNQHLAFVNHGFPFDSVVSGECNRLSGPSLYLFVSEHHYITLLSLLRDSKCLPTKSGIHFQVTRAHFLSVVSLTHAVRLRGRLAQSGAVLDLDSLLGKTCFHFAS